MRLQRASSSNSHDQRCFSTASMSSKLPEVDNAKTDPSENHQDNGATPPVSTQPSPPYSSLKDNSVASAAPSPGPRIEAANTALQEQEGDLPDICLLNADYMLYGVYQD